MKFEIKEIDGEQYIFVPTDQYKIVSDMNSVFPLWQEKTHIILKKVKPVESLGIGQLAQAGQR